MNAGMPEPVRPTSKKYFHFSQGIFFQLIIMIGRKASPEIAIRIAAKVKGGKEIKAFFIKMKELPQVNDKKMKRIQTSVLLFIQSETFG